MKTTYQHSKVASLAIVVEHTGRVTLRSLETRATTCDWWLYESACSHFREFDSVEAARAVALTVCPVFHGTAGPVAQFGTFRVDAWNHWTAV